MKFWPLGTALVVLLVTFGSLQSLSHGERIVAKKPFSSFPLSLGDRWVGDEMGLEQDVLDILKVNDYMMRLYKPTQEYSAQKVADGVAPVFLYVGFYESQRTGATYHSPKNCLPGAGWQFVESDTVTIPLFEGTSIHINKVLIQKGIDYQLILYWYHDRGRVIASEYWAKGFMIWDAMTKNRTDGSLVRISIPVIKDPDHAFQVGVDFLKDFWPMLLAYMPETSSGKV